MPAADAHPSRETALSALRMIIVCLCAVTLAGCKKDQEQTETGDVKPSPVSVIGDQPVRDMLETLPPLPSPDMKGLSIEIAPQGEATGTGTGTEMATSPPLPDMAAVPGMEMSVRISPRMKATPGWTQAFGAMLPPMMNCLMQADGGAAYVTNITGHDRDALGIDIATLAGENFRCVITASGIASLRTSEDAGRPAPVLFFPRSAGTPVLENPDCYDKEAVVARPNGLIGWLAFARAACPARPD